MRDRLSDPAAEETSAPVRAEHTPDRLPDAAAADKTDRAAARPHRVQVNGRAAVDPEPPTPPRPRPSVEPASAREPGHLDKAPPFDAPPVDSAPREPASVREPAPLDLPPLGPPPLGPLPLDPPPLGPPPLDPPPLDPPPTGPVARALPPRPDARPRIVEDPAILGLSRVSRSRLGARLFTWFFVFVYALILIQLIVTLLQT